MATVSDRLFEPGPAREEDLLLIGNLARELRKERWTDITYWEGGLRAKGWVRHTIFGVLHVKHQKADLRRGLVRRAALRLLEARAAWDLSDELCLVTDAAMSDESDALLSSAGIDWRSVSAPFVPKTTVVVGQEHKPTTLRGPRQPWQVSEVIRGLDNGKRSGQELGIGAGHVRVRLKLDGEGKIELSPRTTVKATDPRYQNAILGRRVIVRAGAVEVLEMFCLNRDAAPSTSKATYELGPLIEDTLLTELFTRVEGKVVRTEAQRELIQNAVWEITEDRGLLPATNKALDDLPDLSA